ncbi:MAG: hypothetical protein L6R43_00690 [Planctomycetes bacterium]|nr:hypothetical protein [Planctomycetota bacterium]
MPDESPPPANVIDEKLRLLGEAIQEIDDALLTRHKLTKRHLDQIDAEIGEVRYYLSFLGDPWKAGFLPPLENLRVTLHKNMTSRRQNRRNEELKAWADRLMLLEKRRELVMEFRALLAARRQTRGPGP